MSWSVLSCFKPSFIGVTSCIERLESAALEEEQLLKKCYSECRPPPRMSAYYSARYCEEDCRKAVNLYMKKKF